MFNYFSTESLCFIYLYFFVVMYAINLYCFSVAAGFSLVFIIVAAVVYLPFRWSSFFALFFFSLFAIFFALAYNIFSQSMIFFPLVRTSGAGSSFFSRCLVFIWLFVWLCLFSLMYTQCLVFCGSYGLRQINRYKYIDMWIRVYLCMFEDNTKQMASVWVSWDEARPFETRLDYTRLDNTKPYQARWTNQRNG